MKIVNILIILIVALLSIAAGLAKVMQTEQEMEFLRSFNLSNAMIIAFGIVQIAGGVLLAPSKTRVVGAVLALLAFVVSAILIFVSGNSVFGLLSMIPVALTALIVYLHAKLTNNQSPGMGPGDSDAG